MIRKTKWIVIPLLFCSMTAGWMYAGKNEEIAPVIMDQPRIVLRTEFSFVNRYVYCGHKDAEEKERYIGMTREEFEKESDGAMVKEFTSETVRAERCIEGYCPLHEIMMLKDGRLCVMNTKKGSSELMLKRDTGITEKQIKGDYREALTRGMVVTDGRTAEDICELVSK